MSWTRKRLRLALAVILVAGTVSVAADQTVVTFADAGALPADWTGGITGQGTAKWDVVTDGVAPPAHKVLRQSGEATFCWAVKHGTKIHDGFVEVKLKPVSGKEDQAGGIVFRFQDGNNYYVVRANALEDNVVLYKTVNGKRSSLPVKGRMFGYGVDTNVPTGRWSTLRVEFNGNLFAVFYQGARLFEVLDDTFSTAGAVGVWTKADSVTLFDGFTFGERRR
jgi:hypothetical protein